MKLIFRRFNAFIFIGLTVLLTGGSLSAQNHLEKVENPSIVVFKSKRRLELYSGAKLIKTYPVGLGLAPNGAKQKRDDNATPEGEYYVCAKNPDSKFYKALIISYPNKKDAERGLKEKFINQREYDKIIKAADAKKCPPFDTALGSDIEIHGNGSATDWTWGCVALDDADMAELYDVVPVGTVITIKP